MATRNFTSPSKLCVLRSSLNHQTGVCVTGIFSWTGKSWRTATITDLVKELPATISDKDLQAEYRAAVKAAKAGL
jgi:hypothetical protein